MMVVIKYIFLFLLFSTLFILPAIIFPFPVVQKGQGDFEPLMLFVVLLIDFIGIVYLIKRIDLSGMKLFLAVVLVFWGLLTFMTQIETWYFRRAMPAITNEVLLKLFLNPFITAATFVPAAIWILGKWKQTHGHRDYHLSLRSTSKEVLALSVTYVFIYFLFGHYVAWQFAEVRTFYSGSPELLGFIEQFRHTLRMDDFLLPFQLLRGFLWILFGLPAILYLKGNNMEKMAACVFLYSVLPSIPLIIDNPFMPAGVRMAHLLEVSTSNALFGLLIGLILVRHKLKPSILPILARGKSQ
jgi:hypothetical protein